MIRVHLSLGLVALFGVSYFAVADSAQDRAEVAAMHVAKADAERTLAEARAGWAAELGQARAGLALIRPSLEAKTEVTGMDEIARALTDRLGGSAVIVGPEGKAVGRAGPDAEAIAELRVLDDVRGGGASVRGVEWQSGLALSAATAAGKWRIAHLRSIDGAAMSGWFARGESARFGVVAGDRVVSAGGVVPMVAPLRGPVELSDGVYVFLEGTLIDDPGHPFRAIALGAIDGSGPQSARKSIQAVFVGLSLSALLMVWVIGTLVGSSRAEERAIERVAEDEDATDGEPEGSSRRSWTDELSSELDARVSEAPGPRPLEETSVPEGSVTSPEALEEEHTSDDELQGPMAGEGALPHPEPLPPPDLYPSSSHPSSPPESPEYASEIIPYANPLESERPSSSVAPPGARRSSITRGFGASPPPSKPPEPRTSAPAPAGPRSGPPSVPPPSPPAPRTSQPVASASPLGHQPHLRSSGAPGVAVVPFDVEHYRVVYNEFVANKRRLGDPVENITLEGFSAKLRRSEEQLIAKHGCRAVRFQVLVRNREVSLRPQLVR